MQRKNKGYSRLVVLHLAVISFAAIGSYAQGTTVKDRAETQTRRSVFASGQDGTRASSPDPAYTPPDAATRRKRFISGLVGPYTLGRQLVGAGIATARNSPEEWGPGWDGFGRRMASNFGKNAIKQATVFGLDTGMGYDSHFYRSKDRGTGARIKNALISPVTARNKNGKRVVGIPRLVGTYGSSVIAYETWYPDRYDWKDGVKSGTISLGFNAAFNLFKEFVWKK
jgi:hypothetical protein